ncbi:MAG: DUF4167 domain-containing protein [Kiloniellaceae bacterium]
MRQGPNGRRPRGRPQRKQHGGQPRGNNFGSHGPEGRVRGNANQVYEKYVALARDAVSAGDRVAAETYFQHAEHYFRIVNASTDPAPAPAPRNAGNAGNGHANGAWSGSDDESDPPAETGAAREAAAATKDAEPARQRSGRGAPRRRPRQRAEQQDAASAHDTARAGAGPNGDGTTVNGAAEAPKPDGADTRAGTAGKEPEGA